jgi:hypothetical protein
LSRSLLEFEHLVQINDPNNKQLALLSREDLWQGLVFRTRYPHHFNPAVQAELQDETDTGFVRILSAGSMRLRDEVILIPDTEIRTIIDGRTQHMHAESITRIEEPEPGYLFVRFSYRRDSISDQGGIDADDFLKSAYLQNDREAITTLRQMFAEGWDGVPT